MARNYNRNETMLDRIMRYGGVQRQPRVMSRPQFVQRGGFVPQQRVVQQVQPRVVQQRPVQRRYTPEEIYAIRMEQAKREYEQMAYQAEMERQAAYDVPNMGQGAAARPYEFLMGEADRLGASSGMVPQAQIPQGQVPQQAEPEEQPLTEDEEAELRIRMMYNDYTRESVERGAPPVSFEEFVQALMNRQQAQEQQTVAAQQPPESVPSPEQATQTQVPQGAVPPQA